MKLRLRNYESKETLKIEVPAHCSLLQLQETVSNLHPSASPYSFRFSLNAKHLLQSQSQSDSLQTLGVASGDLIFYTINPNTFSPMPSPEPEGSQKEEKIREKEQITESSVTLKDPEGTECMDSQKEEKIRGKEQITESGVNLKDPEGTEYMDVDDFVVCERVSKPYFSRFRVLREEIGDGVSEHRLLAIAVHAVLMDSGFVGFDPVLGQKIDGFYLPDEWPSPVSICYTLPEILGNGDDYVVLKFQNLVHFVQVYGSLGKGSLGLYRLCLDEHKFAPTLNLVWANSDKNDGSYSSYPEKEVFEFWKMVKDGLALPLMVDLCYRAGLPLPACLIRLPTELKLRIIECLPGVDIARIACVCSEMRQLASSNDMWKLKVKEEFGDSANPSASEGKEANWKMVFRWESKRKRKMERHRLHPVVRPFYFPVRQDPNPNPFGPPPFLMIGGDYNRVPGLALPPDNMSHGQVFPPHRVRRNRGFCCHLGERHDNV